MARPKGMKNAKKTNDITLDGIFGEFNTPKSNIKVKFFSTYASSVRNKNYQTFLKELKPMREKLTSDDITDMDQVLQRDLDDNRIFNSLLPYLLNKKESIDHIAFFPSILVVLLPKDYIKTFAKNKHISYPKVVKTNEELEKEHSKEEVLIPYVGNDVNNESVDMWTEKRWPENKGVYNPLGQLVINLDEAEVIVLDGQHRANAFRVINGVFFGDQPDTQNHQYKVFYGDYEIKKSSFDSDLPVTIIWFEKNKVDNSSNKKIEIKPELVTRRVFIDVNNTTRKINKSREILLNDREPSPFFTSCFYGKIANDHGFSAKKFSLLHLGFDMPYSLGQNKSMSFPTITSPEIVHIIIEWTYFSSGIHAAIDKYFVGRSNNNPYNTHTFRKYFKDSHKKVKQHEDLNQEKPRDIKIIDEPSINNKTLREEFNKLIHPVFERLFSEFIFIKPHISAVSNVEKEVAKKSLPEYLKTWNSVYKGGEGLYYSYDKLKTKGKSDIQKIIFEINKMFYEIRIKEFNKMDSSITNNNGLINEGFTTFTTIAFQIALFNAFYTYSSFKLKLDGLDYYDENKIKLALNDFIKIINDKGLKFWLLFFTEFKSKYINDLYGELTPKIWPTFQNLILRFIDSANEFYDDSNESPERHYFKKMLEKRIKTFINNEYSDSAKKKLTNYDVRTNHLKDIEDIAKNINADIKNYYKILKETVHKFDWKKDMGDVIDSMYKN